MTTEPDEDTEAFWAKHAAGGLANVVAVHAQQWDGSERLAIFSTLAKARAWADTLSDDECMGAVFVPYVIDTPEFGNVPHGGQQ